MAVLNPTPLNAPTPLWMGQALRWAALYNVLFGAWVVLWPNSYFVWAGMAVPNYPQLWQCIGMIVGVYGLGYWVASFNPLKHWPIVLVGFLGKIFGPLGFLQALITGALPWKFGAILLTNDFIWWVPFFLILKAAYQQFIEEPQSPNTMPLQQALATFETQTGQSLEALSHHQPVLLVCLRHFGCTFCRQMVQQLVHQAKLPASWLPVFVHNGTVAQAQAFFAQYATPNTLWVQDLNRTLYKSLGLRRGHLGQLFGWPVWVEGFKAGVLGGYGIGPLQGDGFQMPGVFLIENGQVTKAFKPLSASQVELPDDFCPLS